MALRCLSNRPGNWGMVLIPTMVAWEDKSDAMFLKTL